MSIYSGGASVNGTSIRLEAYFLEPREEGDKRVFKTKVMSKFIIESAEASMVYFVKTTELECNYYTRYSKDCWFVRMGESDEPVYDCAEIEAKFIEYLKLKPN